MITTGGFERIAYHEAGHVAVRRHFERAVFLERGYVLIDTAGGYGQTGLSGQAPPIDHPSIVTVKQAELNPTAFMSLVGKIIPQQIDATIKREVTELSRDELIAHRKPRTNCC